MQSYTKELRLSKIIDHNPLILMLMSRFGISLGFGDKSVEEICRAQEVDCRTFLGLANFISFGQCRIDDMDLTALMKYLDNAHTYFMDFCLPMIRRKLIDSIGWSDNNELPQLILKFYDEYVAEVHRHMDYESVEVFAYVRALLDGRRGDGFNIDMFASRHHSIHDKLRELKDILIRYFPQRDSNLLNAVLFDIINCEQDLLTHCRIEDVIFVPAVRSVEDSLGRKSGEDSDCSTAEPSLARTEIISARERDIIESVARGLSNKEIADRLCISINTVTTHRRNIAQKLHIHSAAGLAIYAVINGILNPGDLAMD